MTSTILRRNISLNSGNAHYFTLNKTGDASRPVHMYHANAYPFGTYKHFLTGIDGDVFGLAHRGTWQGAGQPEKHMHWHHYADDLIQFLDATSQKPVIGMGHSLGAVATTLAAAQRPDLFSALVLIDPVFIPTSAWLAFRGAQKIRPQFNQMAAIAERRPNRWRSRKDAVVFHQSKRAFSAFTSEAMVDFGQFGIVETDSAVKCGDFSLAYPREWEAHNYRRVPYVWPFIKSLSIPVLGIRGITSDVLHPLAFRKWQRLQPDHQLVELDAAGHMAPQEAPSQCAEVINRFLRSL